MGLVVTMVLQLTPNFWGGVIALDATGKVYFADSINHRVRVLIPYASSCTYNVSPTSLNAGASGGSLNVSIQTDAVCSWSITGLPSWITIPGGASGTGPATVTLVAAANPGVARSATLSIAGVSVTVNQAGSVTGGCTYAISAGGQAFTAAGGSGSFSVTTTAGCSWTAVSSAPWITSTSNGTGNGSVTYQVAANTGAARSGSITIGGLTFTIQEAASTFTSTSTAAMPHLAVAGTWTTTITLVNTGSTVAQTRLNFFDDNGSPLTLPLTFPQTPATSGPLLAATLDQTLNPGAILVIQSTGSGTVPIVGWAQLLTNGSVGGLAIFGSNTGTTDQQVGINFENRNAASYIFPFDNTGTFVTAVALANTSTQGGNIGITIRDGTGALVFSSTIALAAQAHTSFVLPNSYGFTAGTRGTVEFDAPPGGQISTLGILFNNATRAFGNIPVLTK